MSVPVDPRLKGKRERLFSWPGLIAVALTIGAVQYLLFPRDSFTLSTEQLAHPDALSINYLQILLRADPQNQQLRKSLTTQLFAVGEVTKAENVLQPLLNDESEISAEVADIKMKLLAAKVASASSPQQRNLRQQELFQWVLNISHSFQFEPMQFNRFESVLSYLSLSQQTELMHNYLSRQTDPERRFQWQSQLADLYLQQGNAHRAANIWETVYFEAEAERRLFISHKWLDSLLATGDPTAALNIVPNLLEDFPDNKSLHQRAVSIALQTEQVDLATLWLSKLVALNPDNKQQTWQLFDLYLGKGNINAARRLVEQLPVTGWSAERTRQVAQLMEWVGEPRAALQYWKLHAEKTNHLESWQRVTQLAIMLNEYQLAKHGFIWLDKQVILNDEQRTQLVQLYFKTGDPDGAIRYLQRRLKANPNSNTDLNMLVKLLREQYQYDQLISLLEPRAVAPSGLSAEHLVVLAESFQALLQPEKAWQLLRQWESSHSHTVDYWQLRMQLAQYLEKVDDVKLSLKRVDQLSLFADALPNNRRYLLAQLLAQEGRLQEAAPLMYQVGRQSDSSSVQLQAIALAIEAGLWENANQWLNEMKPPEDLNERAYYWAHHARVAEHRQHYSEARLAWQHAIRLAPNEFLWKEALTWLLMREPKKHSDELESVLNQFATVSDNHRYLPLLAWGYLALQKPEQSVYWFKRGFYEREDDWEWLNGMAQAMSAAGMHDYAWKLRRRVLYLLQQKTMTESITENVAERETRLQLTRQLRGAAIGWSEWGKLQHHSESLTAYEIWKQLSFIQALSWALEEQNKALVNALVAQAEALNIQLPGWQLFSIALQNGEHSELQYVLEQFNELPLADKMVALDRLGRRNESIAQGLEFLHDQQSDDDILPVKRILVGQRAERASGYRLSWKSQQLGDLSISQSELLWQKHFDDWAYKLQWDDYQVDAALPLRPELNNHTDSSFGWQYYIEQTVFSGYMGRSYRGDESVFNFGLGGRHLFEQDSSIIWSLDWHLRPQLSSATWLQATENRITLQHNQQWFSRLNTFAGIRWQQIDDLAGEQLATGGGLDLGANYLLFAQDPTWQLSSSIQWYRYNRVDSLTNNLLSTFINPVSMDAVVPEEFGRLGVSTRWSHGDVHAINHQVPSPRWHLAFNLGYQWLRKVSDYGVSAGMGWRIFGDDELGLSYDWVNEDALGNNNWTLWLSYNRALSR